MCLLPEELLTFCSVIYSNLSKKMSSHFTRRIQDNIAPPPPPPAFFSADAHVCMCVYRCMTICIVCLSVCLSVCMYVCLSVCVCMYVYVCVCSFGLLGYFIYFFIDVFVCYKIYPLINMFETHHFVFHHCHQ